MASPHVAGVAALYLESNPSASAQAVYDFITETSTKSVVTNSRTTNNHMLYSLGSSGGGGGTDPGDGGGTDPGDGGGTDPGNGDPQDPAGIELTANGFKNRGRWATNLSWSGNTGSVDIYRDGAYVRRVSGSSFTDQTSNRGGGSLTYQVCEAGTSTCSNEVTVNF
jgi:hypothetical protein